MLSLQDESLGKKIKALEKIKALRLELKVGGKKEKKNISHGMKPLTSQHIWS